MTRNIYFDLDGTLLDSRNRIHRLFCELVGSNGLNFKAYWQRKREGVSQKTLLQDNFCFSEEQAARFKQQWLENIEDSRRLQEDTPYPGACHLLQELSTTNSIYIVTGRQDIEKVCRQIEPFGWLSYIRGVLVTGLYRSKEEVINENQIPTSHDVIIGDSGEDLLAGKKLGIKTVAVTYGFNSRDRLLSYHPDMITDELDDVAKAIEKL